MESGTEASLGYESPALLAAARNAGYEMTERLLESFRAQGLMPRPVRAGSRGRVPVWRSRPGAERQLLSLLHWRERTKDPNVLRVQLWLDGYPMPDSDIRAAIVDGLGVGQAILAQEIEKRAVKDGLDVMESTERREAVRRLASTVAGKRGPKALPRHGRVSADERSRASELLLRVFGLGEQVEVTEAEAGAVERILGLAPRGRSDTVFDAGPWLTGPATALFDAAPLLSIPSLISVAGEATEFELSTARGVVVALCRHLPVMGRLMATLFDDADYAGMAELARLEQSPEVVLMMVPAVVGMIRAGWDENLQGIASALSQVDELRARTMEILDLSTSTLEANLRSQPAETQVFLRRIVNAAVEGSIDAVGP